MNPRGKRQRRIPEIRCFRAATSKNSWKNFGWVGKREHKIDSQKE